MDRVKTSWPKLIEGHTYRFTFSHPDGTHRFSDVWTIGLHGSAGAFRAYVMRWTKNGRNIAVINDETTN